MFWLDRWVGKTPFVARFPDMFSIAVDPRISVKAALIDLGRLASRRPFGPPDTIACHELLTTVALHESDVDQSTDRTLWHLEPSSNFSAKSLYQAIAANPAPDPFELIWKIRLRMKIRIFMWQWIREQVPYGVELLKRHGPVDGQCPLCGSVEDSSHIIFSHISVQFL
ncbi:hypothetical protein ZWY2020_033903 [Hordeum vulgare]|nr:hypothetical protein ZWY2020_033903 [Hordeum vulgare]